MEKISAKNRGRSLYLYENYTYKKQKVMEEKTYLRCNCRGCPATGILVKETEFSVRRKHNHDPDPAQIDKLRLREELRVNALKHGSRQKMRQIFNETCEKFGFDDSHLSYRTMKHTMYRAKKVTDIPIPKDLKEYADCLADVEDLGKTKDDPPQPFFQRFIERRTRTMKAVEEWSAVVFVSPTFKPLFASSSTLHIDASYKAVPKDMAKQLITIYIVHMDHLFPAIHVLMTGNTEECYAGILNEVVTTACPESRRVVRNIVTEYSLSLMNAASSAWPNATVTGCLFHYAQDIYRKHMALMINQVTAENLNAKTALQMLIALPLLPAEMLVDGLHEIHQYLLQNGLQVTFGPLVEYIESHWIMTVGVHNISVFQQMHRTNNGVAGFQFTLLSKLGSQPHIWKFTGALQAVEHIHTADYSKILNGKPVFTDRRRGQKCQDQNVERCWKVLTGKGFNTLSFLISAAHAVEGLEERIKELIRVEDIVTTPPLTKVAQAQAKALSTNKQSPRTKVSSSFDQTLCCSEEDVDNPLNMQDSSILQESSSKLIIDVPTEIARSSTSSLQTGYHSKIVNTATDMLTTSSVSIPSASMLESSCTPSSIMGQSHSGSVVDYVSSSNCGFQL